MRDWDWLSFEIDCQANKYHMAEHFDLLTLDYY